MRIDINEVEKALLNLLNELRSQKGDVIEMEPVDYYWSIDRDELYNPYSDPTHLTLGQLTDDLEEIKKLYAIRSGHRRSMSGSWICDIGP